MSPDPKLAEGGEHAMNFPPQESYMHNTFVSRRDPPPYVPPTPWGMFKKFVALILISPFMLMLAMGAFFVVPVFLVIAWILDQLRSEKDKWRCQ